MQAVYSPTERHLVYCVTRNEVILMDLDVNQVRAARPP